MVRRIARPKTPKTTAQHAHARLVSEEPRAAGESRAWELVSLLTEKDIHGARATLGQDWGREWSWKAGLHLQRPVREADRQPLGQSVSHGRVNVNGFLNARDRARKLCPVVVHLVRSVDLHVFFRCFCSVSNGFRPGLKTDDFWPVMLGVTGFVFFAPTETFMPSATALAAV